MTNQIINLLILLASQKFTIFLTILKDKHLFNDCLHCITHNNELCVWLAHFKLCVWLAHFKLLCLPSLITSTCLQNSLLKGKTLYITTYVLQNLFHFGRVSNKKVQWRLIIQQHCVSNILMSYSGLTFQLYTCWLSDCGYMKIILICELWILKWIWKWSLQ